MYDILCRLHQQQKTTSMFTSSQKFGEITMFLKEELILCIDNVSFVLTVVAVKEYLH